MLTNICKSFRRIWCSIIVPSHDTDRGSIPRMRSSVFIFANYIFCAKQQWVPPLKKKTMCTAVLVALTPDGLSTRVWYSGLVSTFFGASAAATTGRAFWPSTRSRASEFESPPRALKSKGARKAQETRST